MAGVAQQLFVPLSLAVGFAMVASYLLSSTLVPVLSTWLMRGVHDANPDGLLGRVQSAYDGLPDDGVSIPVAAARRLRDRWRRPSSVLLLPRLGTEIFPTSTPRQFQLRLRAPTGTRIERTELWR